MNKPAPLFIISGPSGVGKSSIIASVLEEYKEQRIFFSVSATTRGIRYGEKDGVDYVYITKDEFKRLIDNNGLLEYNINLKGDMYGTPEEPLRKAINEGRPAVLDIEVNGMRNTAKRFPEAIKIFIAPPSFEVLEHRLRKRATESEEDIQKRIITAKTELEAMDEYDYVVINDVLEDAIKDTLAIFSKFIENREQ